jgi:hypothetical protein
MENREEGLVEEYIRAVAAWVGLELGTAPESLAQILEEQIGELRNFPLSDPMEADPEFVFDPRWDP